MALMWDEIFEQPEAIERCYKNNFVVIQKIVEVIKKKDIKLIFIAARGTSDHAAVYGRYVFELLLGIPVGLAAPSIFTIYKKSMNFENALVIAISQSGEAADAIEVLRNANKQGSMTLGITNYEDSPIALEADFHLFCSAGIEKSLAATKTFITQMFLLAALAAHWSNDKEMLESIKKLPEKIKEVLKTSDAFEKKVERYRFMKECFVLARGVNYSISLEAALKMQETSYVRAKAFATSDFRHGPIAMIEGDIPVILFAPNGPLMNDLKNMIKLLKEYKIELIVVSNVNEILDCGDVSFRIPDTKNDMISSFYNVVVAQMFACKLSILKGLNPDEPRMLKKVTITK
jgi:glucosamine--fructose-6-phosphate aminotransferase (isomerizing)